MSRIDELIAELCPEGVEFRELGDIGLRNKGTAITARQMKSIQTKDGPIRIFAGGQTIVDVANDAVPEKDIVGVPSIIVKSRGHIGFSYYDRPFTHKAELWSYSINDEDVEQKFVYYYLLTKVDFFQKIARATSVKLPQLSIKDTDTYPIPILPLEVQREIVKVLDTFTELEAELEAELGARRRQYQYYRDTLLSFGEQCNIRWTTLEEIGYITIGEFIHKNKQNPDGKYPVYNGGISPTGYYDEYNNIGEKIIVSARGANAGFVNKIYEPYWAGNSCYSIDLKGCKSLDWNFVYYFMKMAESSLTTQQQKGGIPAVSKKQIETFRVPIPPLEVQREIIKVLDTFTQLEAEVEAELEARRRQYQYYRDRLLTFKKST